MFYVRKKNSNRVKDYKQTRPSVPKAQRLKKNDTPSIRGKMKTKATERTYESRQSQKGQ